VLNMQLKKAFKDGYGGFLEGFIETAHSSLKNRIDSIYNY